MRKIAIATHGEMAAGMKSTLALFTDKANEIEYICGYVDDVDVEKKIEAYISGVDSETEIIVLTDLLGGSVNAAFLPYLERSNFYLVAGLNLGMVLEILALEEDEPVEAGIEDAIENAKTGMVYVNRHTVTFDKDDDL